MFRRGGYEAYPAVFHPKKKQRLLTFLANEAASQSTSRADTFILSQPPAHTNKFILSSGDTASQPTPRTDTFLLGSGGAALAAASQPTTTIDTFILSSSSSPATSHTDTFILSSNGRTLVASQPTTRTDTFILSSTSPALMAVSSNSPTALIFNPAIRYLPIN